MNEAKLYGKEKLLSDLQAVGRKITKEITVYLIGGCAMCLRDLKLNTKDVDAIFVSKDELDLFKNELIVLGYEITVGVDAVYEKLGAYTILRHSENAGFDLFHIKVCDMLLLSEDMKKRATNYGTLDKLTVKLLSNEDITLFKAITDRPRDINDIELLVRGKADFDWNIIKNECKSQAEHLKIEGHLYNRLLELFERYQIRAPILPWLKNRDKRHLLHNAYVIRLKKGFTYEQIMGQFRKEGFSKKDIAILDGFGKEQM